MILRESRHCRKGRRAIGYWRQDHGGEPDLADPRDFVDPSWDTDEKARVIAYVKAGQQVEQWRGYSYCRFCGCQNGSTCLGDDLFNWPCGFAHYLEAHQVRPSSEFVAHVLARLAAADGPAGGSGC